MKCQILFSGKNKKISICHLLNLPIDWLKLCYDAITRFIESIKYGFSC